MTPTSGKTGKPQGHPGPTEGPTCKQTQHYIPEDYLTIQQGIMRSNFANQEVTQHSHPGNSGIASVTTKKVPSAQITTHADGNMPAPSAMKNTRTSNTLSASHSNRTITTKAVTQNLIEPLKEMLAGYKDKRYVIQGLEEGFDIAYKGEQIGFDANNAH